MKLQWFKVQHKGQTYQELGNVLKEENDKCYLSDGAIIPSSRKCNRNEYPLLPAGGKLK